jgi:hypothetical protein
MRFLVESYNLEADDWDLQGSILLPPDASNDKIHAALKIFELNIAIGADHTYWCWGDSIAAIVYDADGNALARLTMRNSWEKEILVYYFNAN